MMTLEEVCKVVKSIEMTSGSLAKAAMIEKNIDDDTFRTVLRLAMDQDRSYGLTKLPKIEVDNYLGDKNIVDRLEYLSTTNGCTASAALMLSNLVGDSPDRRELVNRILKKDLKCGVGAKIVNDIRPGIIYRIPYQRFSSFSSINKLKFEGNTVLAQIKYDGMFGYMLTDKTFVTRNGSKFSLPNVETLLNDDFDWVVDFILMGELLVVDGDKILSRQEGNGILNSIIQGSPEALGNRKVKYVVWGYITQEDFNRGYSGETYLSMWGELKEIVPTTSNIVLSHTQVVKSLEEALDFYRRARARKEEGAMVKVANLLKWKDESSGSKYGFKLKPFVDGEFRLTDVYYGDDDGRFSEVLGGFVVESECGKVTSKVGSGMSDEMRNLGVAYWKEQVGKIVTVRFTGLSKSKDKTTYSLQNPRFVETRFNEKDTADDYLTLLRAENNAELN